jgi:hypothetical protein
MRALKILLSFSSVISSILAANTLPTTSHSNSQPISGKLYYQIYLKNDTTTIREFIQNIVGAKSVFSWIDVDDRLMHWAVEASPEEVTQLKANKDIDRLDEIHSPLPSSVIENTDVTPRTWSRGNALPKRQDPEIASRYGVTPTDGRNTTETSQTQKALQLLLGDKQVKSHVDRDGSIFYWQCGCKSNLLPKPLPTFTGLVSTLANPGHHSESISGGRCVQNPRCQIRLEDA